MASGAPVVQVLAILPPASNFAVPAVRQGGSTPAERVRVYQFPDAALTYMDYLCRLVGYDGGGLTFSLPWSAATATANATRWEIAIRRMQDDAEDIDVSHTYDYNAVDDTAPSAAGELSYPTVSFTDGADMDSWVDGELAVVRVRRNGTHANDSMTDTAQLWAVTGVET